MHQNATWYGPRDFVLDGDPAPPKRGRNPSPIFGPSIVAKRLDGSRWHLAWRWVLVHATLCWMGTQLPSPKTGHSPQFSAHFYCVQTAGCMKLPLRMEVCLSSGDFVLGGVPAPAKGAQQPPPLLGLCLLWLRSPISATAELL